MKADLKPSAHREICDTCRRAKTICFCGKVKSFAAGPSLVLLTHPKESRKAIGTARIVHRCIENSILIRGNGTDFDRNEKLQALLASEEYHSVLLYPGKQALNLTEISPEDFQKLPYFKKKWRVVLVDGTWAQANRMLKESNLLKTLPQICFTPKAVSNYRIRKEPKPAYVSTLEASHSLLKILSELGRYPTPLGAENLLEVFDWMVDLQIEYHRAHSLI